MSVIAWPLLTCKLQVNRSSHYELQIEHLFGGVLGADGTALGCFDAIVHRALGLQHARQGLLGSAQRLVHRCSQRLVVPARLCLQRARLPQTRRIITVSR